MSSKGHLSSVTTAGDFMSAAYNITPRVLFHSLLQQVFDRYRMSAFNAMLRYTQCDCIICKWGFAHFQLPGARREMGYGSGGCRKKCLELHSELKRDA